MRKPRLPKPEVLSCRPFLDGFDTLIKAGAPRSAFSTEVLAAVERVRVSRELVPWELFLDVLDQGRAALGGDRAFMAAFDRFVGDAPEITLFRTPEVRVQTFIRALFDAYGASSFPFIANAHQELPDGSVELILSVPESFRDTSSFWLACVAVNRTRPRQAGFAPAQAEFEITPQRLHMRLRFDASKRAQSSASETKQLEALKQVLQTMRENVERALERAQPPPTLQERVAAHAEDWSLTRRQSQVLACICRGMSNQKIAQELGCARKTVELHVTELLRKAGLESRAQLLSRLADSD